MPVIDDEDSVRQVARAMLERLGYHVLTTGDDQLDFQILEEHGGSITAVLVDVGMPGPSRPKVEHAIRERYPNLRIVVMSGYNDEETPERRTWRKPPGGFLQKPFRLAELTAATDDAR